MFSHRNVVTEQVTFAEIIGVPPTPVNLYHTTHKEKALLDPWAFLGSENCLSLKLFCVICVHSKYIMYLDLFFFCILFSFVFAVLVFIFLFSPVLQKWKKHVFFQKNSQCCLVDNAIAGVGGLLRPILMTLSICQEEGTCKKVAGRGNHLSLSSAVTLRLRTGYFLS